MHKMPYVLNSIISQLFSEHIYRVLALIAAMGLMLVSNGAFAADPNPFSTPDDFSAGSCPIGHKKYSIGNNASTATTQPLSLWEAGEASRTFNFNENSGNKTFTIKFPILIDLDNSNGTVPFYGSNSGVSSDAINLVHNSTRVQTDHTLDITINRPVSKIGYKIQDLDSTSVTRIVSVIPFRIETRVPYIERVDVSANNGRLTFSNIFHNINAQNNIVTAKEGENCDTNQCTIDATWGYKSANNVVNLKHSNEKRETSGSHAIGYSDFYFCLAPPKLIVKKVLNGTRINDSSSKRDQFEIKVTGGSIATNAFTTTGAAAAVTNDSSDLLSLAEATTYTITETVLNGSANDYIANYTCNNTTTGSTFTTTSGAMTLNTSSTPNTRSFTLSNTNFGDEITCTITNTPKSYTFSGTVFNDNGGITSANASDADLTTGAYANNPNYFNGVFNTPPEAGITGSAVSLVNCAAPTTVYGTQTVSSTGTFQISASASMINSNANNICLIEERSSTDYPIRTNSATRKIAIQPNTLSYANNNFGRVIAANAALVLQKYQFVNDCNASTLVYASVPITGDPRTGFSMDPIQDNITPQQCIAYKITATNRANLAINNFVMSDVLQKKDVKGAQATSIRVAPTDPNGSFANGSVDIGLNGTVQTTELTLPKITKRDFYFNTKYSTTVNP